MSSVQKLDCIHMYTNRLLCIIILSGLWNSASRRIEKIKDIYSSYRVHILIKVRKIFNYFCDKIRGDLPGKNIYINHVDRIISIENLYDY